MATCYTPPKSALSFERIEATATPARIMVEDPHGYVVPSEGVLIVGRVALPHLLPLGFPMRQYPELARPRMIERKVPEPTIKAAKYKAKRLHKGLRP